MASRPTYIVKGVKALHPRMDKTYKWSDAKNKSVPCDPKELGAEFSLNFVMDDEGQKGLWAAMRQAYTEEVGQQKSDWPERFDKPFEQDDDGNWTHKAATEGAYNGEPSRPPSHVDAKRTPLPDGFMLTGGSTINLQVSLHPYYIKKEGKAGVKLRPRAVQVLKYAPMPTRDPFEEEEGFTIEGGDGGAFAVEATPEPVAATPAEDDWEEDVPVKEPKKMVKKSAAPKEEKESVTAVIDEWDD
jgi:hypothetical protein